MNDFSVEHYLGSFEIDDATCDVHIRLAYDGLEHLGRLWFSGEAVGSGAFPDHGVIPGRTNEEAVEFAKRFTPDDLSRRYFRARAEKRKFLQLRAATNTFLDKIKHMNRVAMSMRAGQLDSTEAMQEMDTVVRQLHELVDTLPLVAGVEEPS